jgi:hypothetical protein
MSKAIQDVAIPEIQYFVERKTIARWAEELITPVSEVSQPVEFLSNGLVLVLLNLLQELRCPSMFPAWVSNL